MAAKVQENCGSCNDKLPKTGDYATCSSCESRLHLETCSVKRITWNNMGTSKQAAWVCISCRRNKKGSSASQAEEDESELTSNAVDDDIEVSSLGVQRAILTKVNALMDMKGKLDSIENSMKFLAEKYDSLLEEVVNLRAENKELKKEMEDLKRKEGSTWELADKLSVEVAELDQYGRRFNLEIHGLKVEGDPRNEKLEDVLKKVARDIRVEYDNGYIHQAHRLQPRRDGKPPTVIVQFFSKVTRDLWLQHGRKAKIGNVFFNENLCPQYRLLLKEAKIRAKTHSYSFVWFRGGRILVKRRENDNNVIVIKTWGDLNKIK